MESDTNKETKTPLNTVNEPRPFNAFLSDLKNGDVHNELTEGLQAVVASVQAHDKEGSITLKLTIKPNKGDGTVFVIDEIKAKCPESTRPASLFYIDKTHNLIREDPRQMKLSDLKIPDGI
jgi:hypothetical protein